MNHPLNLLIVDDHPSLRSGLALTLEYDARLKVRWQAGDCAEARRLFAMYSPDVTLLDVRLPGGSGMDLLAEFHESRPGALIIILTSEAYHYDVRRARELGAAGYLLKTEEAPDIAATVLRVCQGARPFPPLQNDLPTGKLTPREHEVLQLMARGVFNKDIASILGTSIHTINTQVRAVLAKLEAADRAEAVGRAYQLGMLKPGM